jgi:phenylalanyl-tRNA synthetase beta chain
MYISHSWLKKYLPEIDALSPDTIANSLTGTLAEVEKYFFVREKLSKIICGEVVDKEKLAGSSKLSLCKVDIGTSINTIICAAPNVDKGQKVAVCLPGGQVYDAHSKNPDDTMLIEERAMMGITSQGMICSPKELNLTDEHEGILVLEPELKVGTDLIPILQDTIYEIENKSLNHRPDCFCHMGIARELSAILNINFVEAKAEPILAYTDNKPLKVEIKVDETLCPRFTAVALNEMSIQPSPLWLQSKLTAIGMRPVNNVVDITNYVMFDVGQPLHAYDYDKLQGHKLVVRQAKDNEELKALNAKNYSLTKEMVVVADEDNIQDLAGIMGGSDSEVTESTKTIVLEAANFNMYNIRRTSRQLGLRSEASTRFEKGQDPNNASLGIKSAIELILDVTNSEITSELIDIYPNPKYPKTITFDFVNVKRFLGLDLSKQEIISIFERLKLSISEQDKAQMGESISLTIPTYRSDLNISNDLLEEIARLYGYSKMQGTLPSRDLTAPKINPISRLSRRINTHLINLGINEVLSYSFVDPEFYKSLNLNIKKCVEIQNPTSPELSLVRNTLIPSLISIAQLNAKNHDQFDIFEINRVVQKELNDEKIPNQPRRIAILNYDRKADSSYLKTKGVLESLLAELSIKAEFRDINPNKFLAPLLHKHRSSAIYINNSLLGVIAELSPKLQKQVNLSGRISFFEIDFDLLLANYKVEKSYARLSVYPEVHRDLSFWIDDSINYQEFTKIIAEQNSALIKNITLLDVFNDPNKVGKKSITIGLDLQSPEKTLTDSEIDSVINTVVEALVKNTKAVLRDAKTA